MAWWRGGGWSRNIATAASTNNIATADSADGWRGGEEEVGLETLPQLIAQKDGVVERRRLVSKHCHS